MWEHLGSLRSQSCVSVIYKGKIPVQITQVRIMKAALAIINESFDIMETHSQKEQAQIHQKGGETSKDDAWKEQFFFFFIRLNSYYVVGDVMQSFKIICGG